MKNVPEKIYLQVGENTDQFDNFNKLVGVSWCAEQINKNDIVYVREDIMIKRLEACWRTILENKQLTQRINDNNQASIQQRNRVGTVDGSQL